MKKQTETIRINKYLADKGFSTRRGADQLIERGLVKINGVLARVGQKVTDEDKVEVGNHAQKKYVYLAYNKPRGVITHSGEEDESEIPDSFEVDGKKERLFPVGRLDKDSSGLITLTNDGRITDRLLNPKYNHSKKYIVTLDKPVTNHLLKWLSAGVEIEGYKTKPTEVEQTGPQKIEIILTEGKKHQIRRMCAALGFQVQTLTRIAIENIELSKLQSGAFRKLNIEEKEKFLKTIGL